MTSGLAIRSMRKCRKSPREGSQATRYHKGKRQAATLQKGSLAGGQHGGVHRAHLRQVLLRGNLADVQAIQKPAQIAQLFGWHGLFDLRKARIGKPCKGQSPCRPGH
jgi:hypothetical protein